MEIGLFLEAKKIYTKHLQDLLAPYLYEGIVSIYREAVEMSGRAKGDKVLHIFQDLISRIPEWSPHTISEETRRIKTASDSYDYLDDLVRAVIRVNLIACTHSNSVSGTISREFAESFTTGAMIHRCYIE